MLSVPQILFAMILGWALLYAWTRRGTEEKVAATAIAAATFLTPVMQDRAFAGPELGILLVDTLLFLVLAGLSLRSRAFWPLWAAGFQLGTLAVHLAAAQMPEMLPAVYAETLIIWSFPVLVVVAMGIHGEARGARPNSGM
jgi:hypothetical protein